MRAGDPSAEQIAAARRLVAGAIGRPPEDIAEDAAIGAPGWDSIGHIAIVLALEAEIGRMLAPAEIGRLRSLSELASLL